MKKDTPVDMVECPSTSFSDYHGFTSMAICNGTLYASYSNSTIFAYSLIQSRFVNRYKGHHHARYAKLAVNDEYLVIGSSDPSDYGLDYDSSKNNCCVWSLTSQVMEDSWTRLPNCKFAACDEVGAAVINPANSDIIFGCDSGVISKWSLSRERHLNNMKSLRSLIQYQRNPSQITKSLPPSPRKHPFVPVHKRRRSGSKTPIIKKRQKSAPLTPITNYFQKIFQEYPTTCT